MTEESKSFTVRDRRHFTPDGQAREVEEEVTSPPQTAAGLTSPTPSQTNSELRESGPVSAGGEAAVDFGQFLVSIGAQGALVLSGQVESLSREEGLAEARSLIGVLEMLKDKTEGRRTPRENDVLEGVLYELRMSYVARARETGA